MRLFELLEGIVYSGREKLTDCEITAVTNDSRQVEEGNLFVCVKGLKFDGHDHAARALEQGAAALVVERDLGLSNQILVENSRSVYAQLCAAFNGRPADRMKLIGITGTNGKTTLTYLIKHILEAAGKKVGLLGTIQNEVGEMVYPAKNTTPDPGELHVMFRRMLQAGCEYVVMEVSSHALDQHRLDGCHFSCAVFTNLTQDHLDYHGTMERYFQAKSRLFAMCDTAVINRDDPYGLRLLESISCKKVTYSLSDDKADYTAHDIRIGPSGSNFTLLTEGRLGRVHFCMPGRYSVSNALAAGAVAVEEGMDFEDMIRGLNDSQGVRGRAEVLKTDTNFTVVCDYAHSPDGLEKIITTFKEFAPARVVTLFGCAGNRDRSKRSKMSDIVAKYSDFVILTSDNPRNEDPMQIIEDAMPGILKHSTPYKVIADRYQAIRWALDNCQKDDILILAGKGHEDYQVLDFGTIHFDEHELVQQILAEKRAARGTDSDSEGK